MVMYGVFTINGHSPTPRWGQRNFTGNQAGIPQSSCVKSFTQLVKPGKNRYLQMAKNGWQKMGQNLGFKMT